MASGVKNRQIFFIIFLTLSGLSIIPLPQLMAQSAGTGAWIPILIATVFFSITVAIILKLGNMFPNKTLYGKRVAQKRPNFLRTNDKYRGPGISNKS